MKAIVLLLIISLMGCTTRTKYGECIGIGEKENPKYEYVINRLNLVWGVVFIETIFVPLNVALFNYTCPVETKP